MPCHPLGRNASVISQPERKSFQELLSAVPLDARGDLAVLRPAFEEFMLQMPLPSDVSLTGTTLGGVPVLEISGARGHRGRRTPILPRRRLRARVGSRKR